VISVIVLTHNRLHLLRECVENVLARTSPSTHEIIIWNNASTDGTREYLNGLSEPRLKVVDHTANVGQNAYAEAFAMASQPYLVELDDDVIDAPPCWDQTLLDAFLALPRVGFLAANLEDDPNDEAAWVMHHLRPHMYTQVTENGIALLKGPTGGGCAMTSRELYDRVGGFRQQAGEVFFLEDAAFIADIERLGYEAAFLEDLRVHHAGGPHYSKPSPEKAAYWQRELRRQAQKRAIKRGLLRIPLVAPLNTRYGWFRPPEEIT
jgi:O-antigen biosynthesis protein